MIEMLYYTYVCIVYTSNAINLTSEELDLPI